jgi:hypothetical protein
MNDLVGFEEAPRVERINTMTDQRRENRKAVAFRLRKGKCAKVPFTRKQGLTKSATLMRQGVPYLNIYKCNKCDHWHLTHKPDRRRL